MYNIDYKAMGRRIREKRNEVKITQEKLAEMIDISPSHIGEIERGTSVCSLEVLVNIATALDLNLDTLVKGINDENVKEILGEYDGILVPGGFGNRGIQGKIVAIKYARENKIPFLGICLGMQMAVVEFARNVLGIEDADSAEFNIHTKNQVIHIMETQKGVTSKGGTMRLGSYPCKIKKDTLAYEIYGEENINERHRHRFEYNNDYKEKLEAAGLIASGTSPDGKLVEIVEYRNHPFFVAGQFHPEFKSRPDRPAPLFRALIKACIDARKNSKS